MNYFKKLFSLLLIIAVSQTLFAQQKSEKVENSVTADFSYDLLQKSYSKNDRISILNKDKFLKDIQNVNFIKGNLYFSGPGFPTVKMLNITGNLSSLFPEFEKLVAGTNLTFDKCTIKNNDGTIIKDFQKVILFY